MSHNRILTLEEHHEERRQRMVKKYGPKAQDEYRVTVIKDTIVEFPELWMEVYIEGDALEQAAFADMFIRAKCQRATDPRSADLVVFTGGQDVNPIYYDEARHPTTFYDTQRDMRELELMATCFEHGIPMFGVCRGAQILHVGHGGKLYQHIDGHTGDHPIYDLKERRQIARVSSVHHQSCIPNKENGMEMIAVTHKSSVRWKNDVEKSTGNGLDCEAFFYRDSCTFGVQGHPEYKGYHQFLQWTLRKIQELIVCNPDVELLDVGNGKKCRRIKPDILAQRDARWLKKHKELN